MEYRNIPGQNHPTVLDELLHDFIRETPQRLCRLRQKISDEDADESGMLAHSLAGSCANLGATKTRQAMILIEKAARSKNWKHVRAELGQVETQLADIAAEAKLLRTTG